MKNRILILAAFITASFGLTSLAKPAFAFEAEKENKTVITTEKEEAPLSADAEAERLYEAFLATNTSMPSLVSFQNAIKGYNQLSDADKIEKELLTVVDFSLPSSEKRMWVLDMATNEVLFHTYVAHGRNTGGKMATKFSNKTNSFQSSLGFYVTGETYFGKNGFSLFIDGMEKGINDNARSRYVVIHGADYASTDFIKRTGRLGRSLGCPAIPREVTQDIIDTIKGKSVLFIYHPNKDYAAKSPMLNAAV